jgi:predicted nucleic acid-binding protein
VIYLDSSVALARVFSEPHAPPGPFWQQQLVSSRLLEFEVWNRVHAYRLATTHASEATTLLLGVEVLEMNRPILSRALEPWPVPVRTLDALHLATLEYLRRQGEMVELATYDRRLIAAAQALGIPLAAL